jgi:hypothetical protein
MDTRENIDLGTATGNGYLPDSDGVDLPGGRYLVHLSGSFQGSTVTLEMGVSGSSFVALTDGVFTGPNADYVLEAPRNASFRASMTGAGSPSPSVPIKLLPVPEEGVVFR